MRQRIAVMVLAVSTAVSAAMLLPHTGSASLAKVPTCIEKTVHGAHIQIGYCP
jgi:hypothetical protein